MAADSVFTYDATSWSVTPAMREAYDTNGYILVRNAFNQEEMDKVRSFVEGNQTIQEQAYSRDDGKDRRSRVTLWNHPGKDVLGVLARTERIAGTMEKVMGGHEVYHYHSKLIMKDARTGGRHVWHQDYGYWYRNGCLFPDMGSVFIPIDDCTKQNGCLQVLKGSHRLGRVDHVRIGEQLGADPERVEKAKEQLEHLHLEMKSGDVLFFHSNLLHTSDQNASERRRWAFIVAFNQRSNNPYKEHHHPQYTPMTKVPDSAVLECGEGTDLNGKWFIKLDDDTSIREKVH
ncbi:probable phytanoyl-CoA dioxygenase [Penaeus japonicus]|uniref:probable phytanoyl-CoA dioxygenase n=1 Tax=Penaeus japonicus TaxID=27405 RepID=UPI001C711E29|nr:probable phytanoyl-CoA dioxygenase [Penaeus japonicus]